MVPGDILAGQAGREIMHQILHSDSKVLHSPTVNWKELSYYEEPNELPWKCLWKPDLWRGDVQHQGHFEQSSEILLFFIPRESISLQFLFTCCQNFQS